MVPDGNLAALFLELLKAAGLPVAAVVVIGTAIALYQFASNLNDQAIAVQEGVLNVFASSSRRVRAYAMFVVSHVTATAITVWVVVLILNDPVVSTHFTVSTRAVLAGIAAYFVIIDWWSLRHGDALPHHLAVIVGLLGSLVVLGYGVYKSVEGESWRLLLAWCAVAFFWCWAVGWASSTGSGLARAIQQA